MEKLVNKKLLSWITFLKLTPEERHGFLQGLSLITNLISSYPQWVRAAGEEKSPAVIYSDFIKAFDTVDHSLVIAKMEAIAVRNNFSKWFVTYLCDKSNLY